MNTCADSYKRNMNEHEWFWMYKPKGRSTKLKGWIDCEMKCMNCDLVKLLGTYLNQNRIHAYVNVLIFAYMIWRTWVKVKWSDSMCRIVMLLSLYRHARVKTKIIPC